jgi:hypothetical protein
MPKKLLKTQENERATSKCSEYADRKAFGHVPEFSVD